MNLRSRLAGVFALTAALGLLGTGRNSEKLGDSTGVLEGLS